MIAVSKAILSSCSCCFLPFADALAAAGLGVAFGVFTTLALVFGKVFGDGAGVVAFDRPVWLIYAYMVGGRGQRRSI